MAPKPSFLLLVLIPALLISGCAGSSSPVSPIGDFPLAKGTTWTYSVTEYQPSQNDPTKVAMAQSIYQDTIVDTRTVGSYFIARVHRTVRLVQFDPGWRAAQDAYPDWWYVVDGNKIYEGGPPLDVNNVQTDLMDLILDFPLELGKSWCSTTNVQKGGSVGNCLDFAKVTVQELKSVTTTAGGFKNCVLVIRWFNDGNILRQFCPGIGFVNGKFDHSGTLFGFEMTLTKFSSGAAHSMSTFQWIALILAVVWFLLVAFFFRRSTLALIIGLVVLGTFTLGEALLLGNVTAADLGLGIPSSWLSTLLFALGGLAVLLAYSPLADRIASRFFPQPPELGAFKSVQRSWSSLVAGIIIAWVLGGFLEELIARGIVLNSIEALLSPYIGTVAAATIAILVAAAGAGVMHSYQGPRAMLIIGQLSVLFGVLFVLSGHNLWTVILAHGLYDTIAFIRFALKKSRYSQVEGNPGN